MTKVISIDPNNISDISWVWDFLEEERQKGKTLWHWGTNFNYKGLDFQFQQVIFLRQRKDLKRGYAYEVLSNKELGRGVYGRVFEISYTLSKGSGKKARSFKCTRRV
jgi:serine/threonine-protein kinase LegK1